MDQSFRLFPEQASTLAPKVDLLYAFIWLVTAFFTLLIFVLIVYLSLRYRRRREDERPRPTIESTRLELFYTAVPLSIVLVIFFWGARLYFEAFADVKDPLEIRVVGKQWMWKIQHPEGRREINELHVPLGRPVQLTMASQDVIHDFSIPAFRVRQDVVPGRYAKMSFVPSKVGEYHLFCAEYCGTDHSGMIGRVVVMEPEKYQTWLTGTSADESPAVSGARLFNQLGCLTCHGSQAPSMAGLYGRQRTVLTPDGRERTVRVDDAYLRESILNSTTKIVPGYQPIMPSYRGQVSEDQLMHLIAYIKSLRDAQVQPGQPAGGTPGNGDNRTEELPDKTTTNPGAGSQRLPQN